MLNPKPTHKAPDPLSRYSPAILPTWKRVVRRAGKRLLAWRFRNFTPGAARDRTVTVGGLGLRVLRGVFDPSLHFTSAPMARYLSSPGVIREGRNVLDLGTGSGIAAIVAARSGAAHVVATDINPAAIECARQNVQRYALGHIVDVRQGDMFSPVAGESFDLVVCNPPYFRAAPTSLPEMAYNAGESFEWLARFARDLAPHLKPGGAALLSIGDAADIDAILAVLADCGWSSREVARRDILVETIYLFSVSSLAG